MVAIQPTNLRMKAAEAIRASIVAGELEPGIIYPVSYFTSRLGVSATPVREALLDLGSEGHTQVARNKGFRITELTEHDLDEIFTLRALLEVPSVAEAIGQLSAKEMDDCRYSLEEAERCAIAGDLSGFLEFDGLFHASLLKPLGNERLLAMISRLKDQAQLRTILRRAHPGHLLTSSREHVELFEAVAEGDAERAMSATKHHIQHTRALWSPILTKE